MKEYVWLFGENLGETSNNNSFYFWEHIVEKKDGIKKMFIMKKNKRNRETYKRLSQTAKKNIVWKNSLKHYLIYRKADMYYVTLSFKDVFPDNLLFKKRKVIVPTIYLQHGTLAIKKIGYKGNDYNNNMFKFFYYNRHIKETLKEENKFKEYQLYYAEFHPRYKELVRRYQEFQKQCKKQKSILWFITWREYFGKNKATEKFIEDIRTVVNNYKLRKYIKENGYKLTICLHQFFNKEKIDYITGKLKDDNIKIVTPDKIDVMDEIVKNDILITDYSSVAFDFTLLGKPVILYQPDINEYSKKRKFYYLDDMKKYVIKTPSQLAKAIIENNNNINEFFSSKLPEKIDYEYLKKGEHIDKIYENFYNMQKNEVTFLGYNFYGVGGTVSATKAIAEGLLEKNYLVRLISLKRTGKPSSFPCGLNNTAFYYDGKTTLQYKIKKLLARKHHKYLRYDTSKNVLLPYAGFALKRKLKNIKSKTVISTRETLHLFLKDASSENIKNKVYFFHTFYNVLQEQFSGLLQELKKIKLEKAVFITEAEQKQYLDEAQYNQYDEYEIINNCLESSRMITREEIQPIQKKKKYNAIYLLRLSKDRIDDIENLFKFARFMKEIKFNQLCIHVYGTGDYVREFKSKIEEENLNKYIKHKGVTSDVSREIRKYDLMIDFSLNHSFGMTYLEAILNGKMLFAMKNQGANIVLKEIPYCYINSFKDLVEKIKNLDNIKLEDLQKNYDVISEKYSRKAIAEKFIKYLN